MHKRLIGVYNVDCSQVTFFQKDVNAFAELFLLKHIGSVTKLLL